MAYSRRPYSTRPYSAQRQPAASLIVRDAGAPAAWGAVQIRDVVIGAEWLLETAAVSPFGPYRVPYGLRPYSAARFGGAPGGGVGGSLVVRDAGVPASIGALLQRDGIAPGERLGLLQRDGPGPDEFLVSISRDALISLERSASLQHDNAAAAESASLATGTVLAPLEGISNLIRRESAFPAAWGASVARDGASPLLLAGSVAADASALLSMQGLLSADGGVPAEFASGLILDIPAPALIRASLVRDGSGALGYAGSLFLDSPAPVAWLVQNFSVAGDGGSGLEILAAMAADAPLALELFGSTSSARGLAEVEQTLVSMISGLIFPTQGYLSGAMVPAFTLGGMAVKIYRGWPEAANLASDVQAGNCHVSIFSDPGMTRNTSRYWPEEHPLPAALPTITVAVAGQTVTVGGTITPGNVVGIQYGATARAWAFAVAAQPGDVADTIAAALAAQIPGASSTGAVITLPYWALNIQAVTMAPQAHWLEVRRQMQGIRVSCWCPNPAARDLLAEQIDIGIAGLRDSFGRLTRFFTVPSGGRVWLQNGLRATYVNDMPARDRVWRRDLCYMVEYPTSLIEAVPRVLFLGGTVTSYGAADFTWGATKPPSEFETSDAGLVSDGTGLLGQSGDAGSAPGGGDDGVITDDQGNSAGTA